MALILQGITFLSIVGLGIISFKRFPLAVTTKKMTTVSLLVVLSVTLQFFSLMVPFFGFPSLRIDFLQIPLMMVGVIFGPSWAFVAGIAQDVLGLIITPTGFPFFGFMLNKILMGMIPALLFHSKHKVSHHSMHQLILGLLGAFLLGALAYVWSVDSVIVASTTTPITTTLKVSLSLLSLLLIGGLMLFIHRSLKQERNKNIPLVFWAMSVLLVEVSISLILTPTWLYAMYNIPVIFSFLVRVVKAVIMMPVLMVVGYGVLNIIGQFKLDEKV